MTITINNRVIGPDHPVYIIAEMSANHGQDINHAKTIMHAMKDAGADAIKIQTYTPDTMTIDCDNKWFKIGKGTIWEGKNLYQLYQEAFTPWEWYAELAQEAQQLGLDFFSTPFDATSVDFLEQHHAPAYKIASFECTDLPLIHHIAQTGKPIILSTGMASKEEIQEAVDTVRATGNDQLILLKCTSAYPAPVEEANLRRIPDMQSAFQCPIGLSDHTLGTSVPSTAVALGACVVEKHFTLSRREPGPDSAFSLEPYEFSQMVRTVRFTEKALGIPTYELTEKEKSSRVFRRSLFVVQDIQKGGKFSHDNVRVIRPSYGLAPKHIDEVIGKKATTFIKRGTPLTRELIS